LAFDSIQPNKKRRELTFSSLDFAGLDFDWRFPPSTFCGAFAVAFSVAAAGHYRLYLWSFSLDGEETPNFSTVEPYFTSFFLIEKAGKIPRLKS
jgi:hypothetical protein